MVEVLKNAAGDGRGVLLYQQADFAAPHNHTNIPTFHTHDITSCCLFSTRLPAGCLSCGDHDDISQILASIDCWNMNDERKRGMKAQKTDLLTGIPTELLATSTTAVVSLFENVLDPVEADKLLLELSRDLPFETETDNFGLQSRPTCYLGILRIAFLPM